MGSIEWIVGGVAVVAAGAVAFWSNARQNAVHQAWVDALRREGLHTRGRIVDLVELHRSRGETWFSVRVGIAIQDPRADHRGPPERIVWVDGIVGDLLPTTTLRIGNEVPIVVRGNDALVEGSAVRAERSLLGGSFPWNPGIIPGLHETR